MDNQPHKILVLSEDKSLPKQLDVVLTKLGLAPGEYLESLEDAYSRITDNPSFTFVLVDMHMAKSAAFTFIEFLYQHPSRQARNIPLIGIVGAVNQAEVNLLAELSVSNFLMRPLTEKGIEARIREILQEYQNPDSEKRFYRDCRQMAGAGDFAKALQLVVERIEKSPRSARLRLLHARLLWEASCETEAQEELTKILQSLPENVAAMDILGRLHFQAGRYLLALRMLERAQQLSPLNLERLFVLGELLLASGRASLAEARFRQALVRCPDMELARVGLARSLVEQGTVEGVADFSKDPLVNEKLVSHLNMKGVTLSKAGKYEEAVKMYSSAVRLVETKAKKASLYYNIALAWNKGGFLDRAIYACKLAIANDPSNAKAKQLLERLAAQPKGGVNALAKPIPTSTDKDPIPFIVADETRSGILSGLFMGTPPPSTHHNTLVYSSKKTTPPPEEAGPTAPAAPAKAGPSPNS